MKKIFVILSILLLALLIWLKHQKPQDAPENIDITMQQVAQKEDTTQKVQSFSISGFSEDSKNRWQVEGESADIFQDIVNMRTIKAKTYGEGVSMVLTADEGTFFKDSKDVELRKNVIAHTDEGTTLRTDRLKWQAAPERIITDDSVYIQREDMDVSGNGAEAFPNMKRVQLNQDIKMTVYPHTKDFDVGASPATIITCDGPLEVDYQNNISYFNKNVIIQDKEGEIYADRVIAYIDPKQKKVYKAVAKGNVKIIHKQNISYSDEAVYLADEGRAILTGRPKVVIYSVDKLLDDTKEGSSESL